MLKSTPLNTGRIIKKEHLKWRLLAVQATLSQELFLPLQVFPTRSSLSVASVSSEGLYTRILANVCNHNSNFQVVPVSAIKKKNAIATL